VNRNGSSLGHCCGSEDIQWRTLL